MKRPENKVENAGASIWTRPALIGWENRRRTCVLPRKSTWLKIAGPHLRDWCNFFRVWISHTYVFASFHIFTTLIFAVLLLNRVNKFALLRNNSSFQWRENRKSIFFTTGSPHAFLVLIENTVTLNFRMHNFFSLFLCTRRVHVNDLPFGLESQTRLFADNCLIYISITSPADVHKLQSDLKKLDLWQSTWQVEFNPEKFFIMCISKLACEQAFSRYFSPNREPVHRLIQTEESTF